MSGALLSDVSVDGVAFTVDGKTYHVEPKALSTKVIKNLIRLYDEEFAPKRQDMINALHGAKSDAEMDVIKDVFGYVSDRFEKVQYMLPTEKGVACVLYHCSPEINGHADGMAHAEALVENHPNFFELVQLIGKCTGLEAVGN